MGSLTYASKWSRRNGAVSVRSNTREFKYVTARNTRRNHTFYLSWAGVWNPYEEIGLPGVIPQQKQPAW
jgi:hypothetical protein